MNAPESFKVNWDYAITWPYENQHGPEESPNKEELDAVERLAEAIRKIGNPPCGEIGDKKSRCPHWNECATGPKACQEFWLWSTNIPYANGVYVRGGKTFKVRDRVPTKRMYAKTFRE